MPSPASAKRTQAKRPAKKAAAKPRAGGKGKVSPKKSPASVPGPIDLQRLQLLGQPPEGSDASKPDGWITASGGGRNASRCHRVNLHCHPEIVKID